MQVSPYLFFKNDAMFKHVPVFVGSRVIFREHFPVSAVDLVATAFPVAVAKSSVVMCSCAGL
jgi:hypothetical protein